ncbi:hypothetical protein CPB86DRAFT_802665 [Serendipita vermifera]|nr:hypothetical protein CPB86DRAFT_802665 [Serendipita vermifera]
MKTEIVESLSLGIISSLKTVAFLDRGPEYPLVIADPGIRGAWEACHSEKQLMVYYLFEHHIRPWDRITTKMDSMCPTTNQLEDAQRAQNDRYFNIDTKIEHKA